MTARTLEEIECDIKRDPAHMEPWRLNPELIRHAPRLLAIAQEQRAELEKAQAQRKEESRIALGIIKHNEYDLERLRNDLATKCAEIERWRGLYYGCDGTDQAASA